MHIGLMGSESIGGRMELGAGDEKSVNENRPGCRPKTRPRHLVYM